MAKKKKLTPDTSYDAIYDRFANGELIKSDYFFIASMFREFKNSITYTLLKARINLSIQNRLRNPPPTSESVKELGRHEGLDACLAIIDDLSKFDDSVKKGNEKQEEPNPDQEQPLSNSSASINDV